MMISISGVAKDSPRNRRQCRRLRLDSTRQMPRQATRALLLEPLESRSLLAAGFGCAFTVSQLVGEGEQTRAFADVGIEESQRVSSSNFGNPRGPLNFQQHFRSGPHSLEPLRSTPSRVHQPGQGRPGPARSDVNFFQPLPGLVPTLQLIDARPPSLDVDASNENQREERGSNSAELSANNTLAMAPEVVDSILVIEIDIELPRIIDMVGASSSTRSTSPTNSVVTEESTGLSNSQRSESLVPGRPQAPQNIVAPSSPRALAALTDASREATTAGPRSLQAVQPTGNFNQNKQSNASDVVSANEPDVNDYFSPQAQKLFEGSQAGLNRSPYSLADVVDVLQSQRERNDYSDQLDELIERLAEQQSERREAHTSLGENSELLSLQQSRALAPANSSMLVRPAVLPLAGMIAMPTVDGDLLDAGEGSVAANNQAWTSRIGLSSPFAFSTEETRNSATYGSRVDTELASKELIAIRLRPILASATAAIGGVFVAFRRRAARTRDKQLSDEQL
ncbi:MAG: hypothetical protein KDB22_26430 [Planctomycetales bacterium]|nr:hypothetical protein [Planctomycetales bacterium]